MHERKTRCYRKLLLGFDNFISISFIALQVFSQEKEVFEHWLQWNPTGHLDTASENSVKTKMSLLLPQTTFFSKKAHPIKVGCKQAEVKHSKEKKNQCQGNVLHREETEVQEDLAKDFPSLFFREKMLRNILSIYLYSTVHS